jgi:fatty acid synthase
LGRTSDVIVNINVNTVPCQGLGSLAKLIIAMEERVIPANLHYTSPNPNIPGLMDGRLKVVSKNTPWKGGLMAINSFGLGGTDVHAILKSNDGEERPVHPRR